MSFVRFLMEGPRSAHFTRFLPDDLFTVLQKPDTRDLATLRADVHKEAPSADEQGGRLLFAKDLLQLQINITIQKLWKRFKAHVLGSLFLNLTLALPSWGYTAWTLFKKRDLLSKAYRPLPEEVALVVADVAFIIFTVLFGVRLRQLVIRLRLFQGTDPLDNLVDPIKNFRTAVIVKGLDNFLEARKLLSPLLQSKASTLFTQNEKEELFWKWLEGDSEQQWDFEKYEAAFKCLLDPLPQPTPLQKALSPFYPLIHGITPAKAKKRFAEGLKSFNLDFQQLVPPPSPGLSTNDEHRHASFFWKYWDDSSVYEKSRVERFHHDALWLLSDWLLKKKQAQEPLVHDDILYQYNDFLVGNILSFQFENLYHNAKNPLEQEEFWAWLQERIELLDSEDQNRSYLTALLQQTKSSSTSTQE